MEVVLNENTPAEFLRELALKQKSEFIYSLYDANLSSEEMPPQYYKSKSILCKIAKNPNTPPDILKELFNLFPIQVLNNVSLSLILLEHPYFLEEVYNTSLDNYTIFGMDNVPLFFEEWGANNNDISIRKSAAYGIKSLFLLEQCLNDDNPGVRANVAANENTPGHILEKLAFDENNEVREATARNINTSKNILSLLAQDKNSKIRIGVASNTNTSEETLNSLAKSKSRHLREVIAGNSNVNIKTLELLAKDECESVLSIIAANKKTPSHILRALAAKNDYFINMALTVNPQTPSDILELIASENDYS